MQLDVVIFGGGASGLWLLDALSRHGSRALLLETAELGQGQTVAAQGIIHGGLKYTLHGLFTPSASHICDMPGIWRDCLAGKRSPALRDTRIRSECCHLWRTARLGSRLGMIGAKFGLRVVPNPLSKAERPEVLLACPGTVARLDEQVIAPESLIADLAQRHRDRILKIDSQHGLEFQLAAAGQIETIQLKNPDFPDRSTRTDDSDGAQPVESAGLLNLKPQQVIFTAGAGNAELRRRAGLTAKAMQRRPLHMVMLRERNGRDTAGYGGLPQLHGHCVDGAKTRATITSDIDSAGRIVWQLGGQIAEDGVAMDELALISHARSELETVIPGLDLSHVEWATYRVDRAERTTAQSKRPETVQIIHEGNCITAWPTKLALVPQLAHELVAQLASTIEINDTPTTSRAGEFSKMPNAEVLAEWPRPAVAKPPWETCSNWHRLERDESKYRAKKKVA